MGILFVSAFLPLVLPLLGFFFKGAKVGVAYEGGSGGYQTKQREITYLSAFWFSFLDFSSQACFLQPCPIQLLYLRKLVFLLAPEFRTSAAWIQWFQAFLLSSKINRRSRRRETSLETQAGYILVLSSLQFCTPYMSEFCLITRSYSFLVLQTQMLKWLLYLQRPYLLPIDLSVRSATKGFREIRTFSSTGEATTFHGSWSKETAKR